MKKLLHERLREAAKNGVSNIETYDENIVVSLLKDEELSLADEIEKYYIPRPRFEDGEPVQFGDSFIQKCVNVEVELDKIGISLFTKDGLNMVWFPDEVVPRPEPKVLDTNGAPCKKGETVWKLVDSTKWEIIDIHPTEPRITVRQLDTDKDVIGGWFLASEYTHTTPETQERIDDDATMPPAEYCAVRGIDLGDDPDRATATEAMVRDLLRRQRELDKRTGGDA